MQVVLFLKAWYFIQLRLLKTEFFIWNEIVVLHSAYKKE